MGSLLAQEQLVDIISLHVCSKLRLCDIQALGQTCKSLRQLVIEFLPASTWRSVASTALPAAHRLRALPGGEVRDYLRRVARAKIILPIPTFLGIWEGQNDNRSTISAINYQGTHILTRKGDAVSLYELTLDAGPPSLNLIFTKAPVEPADVENHITITWSKAGNFAAVAFAVCDGNDPRAEPFELDWYDTVWIYDVYETIQELTHTQEYATLIDSPLTFSPSGQQLIVSWEDSEDLSTLLDVYNLQDRKCHKTVRLRESFNARECVTFSPDSQLVAATLKDGAVVYASDTLAMCGTYKVDEVSTDERKVQVCFSPDGAQLGIFLRSTQYETRIHLFDTATSKCRSFAGPILISDHSYGPDPEELFISFHSLVALRGRQLFLYSIKPESFGKPLLEFESNARGHPCLFAVSPDGIFLAALSHFQNEELVKHQLHIIEMATGRDLHSYHRDSWSIAVEGGYPQAHMSFTLTWASSGLRLLVGCRCLTNATSNDPGREVDEVIVFTF